MVKTHGGADSILAATIVPAVLASIPPGPVGTAGPGGITEQQLQAALLVAITPLTGAIAEMKAQLANIRIRQRNSRLLPREEWIPLQREVPQQGDVPVGMIPAAGLIPYRNLPNQAAPPNQTPANLHALSAHYGVVFAQWQNFFDFLV